MLLRLGWLTVLSSRNIVEQELYFFVSSPGDICKKTRRVKKDALLDTRASRWAEEGASRRLRDLRGSCSCFSFSRALKESGKGCERGWAIQRRPTEKHLPSVCDLLRKRVLALGWSEGLASWASSAAPNHEKNTKQQQQMTSTVVPLHSRHGKHSWH